MLDFASSARQDLQTITNAFQGMQRDQLLGVAALTDQIGKYADDLRSAQVQKFEADMRIQQVAQKAEDDKLRMAQFNEQTEYSRAITEREHLASEERLRLAREEKVAIERERAASRFMSAASGRAQATTSALNGQASILTQQLRLIDDSLERSAEADAWLPTSASAGLTQRREDIVAKLNDVYARQQEHLTAWTQQQTQLYETYGELSKQPLGTVKTEANPNISDGVVLMPSGSLRGQPHVSATATGDPVTVVEAPGVASPMSRSGGLVIHQPVPAPLPVAPPASASGLPTGPELMGSPAPVSVLNDARFAQILSGRVPTQATPVIKALTPQDLVPHITTALAGPDLVATFAAEGDPKTAGAARARAKTEIAAKLFSAGVSPEVIKTAMATASSSAETPLYTAPSGLSIPAPSTTSRSAPRYTLSQFLLLDTDNPETPAPFIPLPADATQWERGELPDKLRSHFDQAMTAMTKAQIEAMLTKAPAGRQSLHAQIMSPAAGLAPFFTDERFPRDETESFREGIHVDVLEERVPWLTRYVTATKGDEAILRQYASDALTAYALRNVDNHID